LGIVSTLAKLADDTKLGTNVETENGINRLKNDLKILEEWSQLW
jgi:hypothetical protein